MAFDNINVQRDNSTGSVSSTVRRRDETRTNYVDGQRLLQATFDGKNTSPNLNNTTIDRFEFFERLAVAERLEHKSIYQFYPTILSMILVAHLIFVYQWIKRKNTGEVLASYRTIVQKRQYHRAIIAMLSHPAAQDSTFSSSNSDSDTTTLSSFFQVSMGNGDVSRNHSHRTLLSGIFLESLQRLRTMLQPLTHGPMNGLPLLFYNSHLLWSCRALEPHYDSNWPCCYARVLIGLSLIGLILELRFTHNLLRNLSTIYPAAFRLTPSASARSLLQTQKTLLNRGIGTLTGLTSAVLVIFQSNFPYVPLQVFPFVDSSIRWWNPFISYLSCLVLLTVLSWKLHPVTSVLFGSISGCLWSSGLISFLGESAWGNYMVFGVGLVCLLSLKAASSASRRRVDWLPCIDYVGWDHRGELRLDATTTGSPGTRRGRALTPLLEASIPYDDGSDDEYDNERDDDVEARHLLARTSIASVETTNVTESDILHGRVPVIDMDNDTLDSAVLVVPPNPNVRSRRWVGNISEPS